MATYPPTVLHDDMRRVVAAEAAAHVSSYLAQAPTSPFLHPDAVFTTTGLEFGVRGGAAGGLALHHLARIEKGLRGERVVAADFDEADPRPNGAFGRQIDADADDAAAGQQDIGLAVSEPGLRSELVVMGARKQHKKANRPQSPGLEVADNINGDYVHSSYRADDGDRQERPNPRKTESDKEARKRAKKEREKQRKREVQALHNRAE